MTGLGPGPEPPILRGHLQNFVFRITLPTYSPLSARRLINTAPYNARSIYSRKDLSLPLDSLFYYLHLDRLRVC